MRSTICILVLLAGSLYAWGQATPVDFVIKAYGAGNVIRGNSLYIGLEATVTAGLDDQMVTPSITGLPSGATPRWLNLERFCCGTKLWRLSVAQVLRIDTTAATSAGTYPIIIRYVTDSGVARQIPYTFNILTAYPAVARATRYGPDTTLAAQSLWESQMVVFGNQHCLKSEGTWEGFAWYYDGARVFYQIADYTRNPAFNACALHELNLYRSYVVNSNGLIQLWRIFPHGLAMNFQRTGDTLSKTAVEMLHAFSESNMNLYHYTQTSYSREVSYLINTALVSSSLGNPLGDRFPEHIELLIGHFDQWFTSKKGPRPQPFMVGLAAEALIDYHARTNDPRIPYLIKLACDEMWRVSWIIANQAFLLYFEDGTSTPAPDLNLLIAPMYGWIYRYTGESKYRAWGDQIFAGGVNGAWLGGGKQFSQNYRWSGKYVEWRKAPR